MKVDQVNDILLFFLFSIYIIESLFFTQKSEIFSTFLESLLETARTSFRLEMHLNNLVMNEEGLFTLTFLNFRNDNNDIR